MHLPARSRIRSRKPTLPDLPTTYLPGGAVASDFGPGLFEVLLRRALEERGIKKPR